MGSCARGRVSRRKQGAERNVQNRRSAYAESTGCPPACGLGNVVRGDHVVANAVVRRAPAEGKKSDRADRGSGTLEIGRTRKPGAAECWRYPDERFLGERSSGRG